MSGEEQFLLFAMVVAFFVLAFCFLQLAKRVEHLEGKLTSKENHED